MMRGIKHVRISAFTSSFTFSTACDAGRLVLLVDRGLDASSQQPSCTVWLATSAGISVADHFIFSPCRTS
jgi:hypothetical protein